MQLLGNPVPRPCGSITRYLASAVARHLCRLKPWSCDCSGFGHVALLLPYAMLFFGQENLRLCNQVHEASPCKLGYVAWHWSVVIQSLFHVSFPSTCHILVRVACHVASQAIYHASQLILNLDLHPFYLLGRIRKNSSRQSHQNLFQIWYMYLVYHEPCVFFIFPSIQATTSYDITHISSSQNFQNHKILSSFSFTHSFVNFSSAWH